MWLCCFLRGVTMYDKSLDIAVLLVFIYSTFSCMAHGFISEIAKLISIALAFLASGFAFSKVCQFSGQWTNGVYYSMLGGVPLLTFLIVGYIFLELSAKLRKIAHQSSAKVLDRLLGFAFGFVKGFVISALCIAIIKNVGSLNFSESSVAYKFFTSNHKIVQFTNSVFMSVFDCMKYYYNYMLTCFK